MRIRSTQATKALCLALVALSHFASAQEDHTAEPPLNPWLWILHDEDTDWPHPPFEDSLTVLDTGGTALFSVADFNASQNIGGNRVVSVFPNEDAAVVCDFVAGRLSKVDRQGQRVFSVERGISAADVAPDGRVFASGGRDLFRVSGIGRVEKEVTMEWGGFDLVLDTDRSRVCVVGADVKCFDEDLNLLWSVDPIPWYGVAVDFATDGSLWIAERES